MSEVFLFSVLPKPEEPDSGIQLIDDSLVRETIQKALDSPRKRMNHNFHELSEVYQRFLNVLTRGTYVRPHRHWKDPKPETFLCLKGDLGFLLFDGSGNLLETIQLSSKGPIYGIDLKPGIWHSLVCLSEVCVCFEGKSGPYNPHTDKEFLPMFPEEGTPQAIEKVSEWESIFVPL